MADKTNLPVAITSLAIQKIDLERVVGALKEAGLDGFNPFTFDQIRVPGAGSLAWTVPTEDGPQPLQFLDVVILHFNKVRQYYEEAYDPTNPNPTPPDCVSYDGVRGTGVPGGACRVCPFGQFGGGCHPGYFLYILFPEKSMPAKLNIPRTSVQQFERYVATVGMSGHYHNEVVTRIGLQARKQGLGSVATFRVLSVLPESTAKTARSYAQMLSRSITYPSIGGEESDVTTGLVPGGASASTVPLATAQSSVSVSTTVREHLCCGQCDSAAGAHYEEDAVGGVRKVRTRLAPSGHLLFVAFGMETSKQDPLYDAEEEDIPEPPSLEG